MGDSDGNGPIAVDNDNRRQRNGRRDSSVITMHDIEIAVDGGGDDGQRRRNGRQDGRASVAGQGDGVSLSSRC
jgi:hypothetical protein